MLGQLCTLPSASAILQTNPPKILSAQIPTNRSGLRCPVEKSQRMQFFASSSAASGVKLKVSEKRNDRSGITTRPRSFLSRLPPIARSSVRPGPALSRLLLAAVRSLPDGVRISSQSSRSEVQKPVNRGRLWQGLFTAVPLNHILILVGGAVC
ncbi:hypothetical protein DFJ73DRAFT_882846 [Zopfochytrium polystomum]|nr:hypothetical protein DFJ73DRAFT_882846 [Zopfochytrium polystomum]